MKYHRYTPEQLEFLRKNVAGVHYSGLTSMFNAEFGLGLKDAQILSVCMRRRIHNGIKTIMVPGTQIGAQHQFRKGNVPFNKGKKGLNGKSSTTFRKGNRPQTWKPVGAERVSKGGLIEVKIFEPRTWRAKHRVIWEQHNGPVPKGHVIIFANGDRRDFTPDNLVKVSRRELAMLNKFGLIKDDKDLTSAGLHVARLILAISDRAREPKKKENDAD